MDEGLLALFEYIQQDFLSHSLDDFTLKLSQEPNALYIYPALEHTPLAAEWSPYWSAINTANKSAFPLVIREAAYKKLKYIVDDIITRIKSGAVSIPKKRIAIEVVNVISDPKIKQICIELNSTPDQNVLSLAQSLGEVLKWILWYRAQQIPGAIQSFNGRVGELGPLLNKATDKNAPYYSDNAARRFLDDFKNNFLKTGYDMVRHDPTYIPDIIVLNPAIDALEHLLKVTFP